MVFVSYYSSSGVITVCFILFFTRELARNKPNRLDLCYKGNFYYRYKTYLKLKKEETIVIIVYRSTNDGNISR